MNERKRNGRQDERTEEEDIRNKKETNSKDYKERL